MRLVCEARGLPFVLDRLIDGPDGTSAQGKQMQGRAWARRAALRAHADAVLVDREAMLLSPRAGTQPLAQPLAAATDRVPATADNDPAATASSSPDANPNETRHASTVASPLPARPALSAESRRALAEVVAHCELAQSRNDPCTTALYAKLCDYAERDAVDPRRFATADADVARQLDLLSRFDSLVHDAPPQKGADAALSPRTPSCCCRAAPDAARLWDGSRDALSQLDHPGTASCLCRCWVLRRFLGALWLSQVRESARGLTCGGGLAHRWMVLAPPPCAGHALCNESPSPRSCASSTPTWLSSPSALPGAVSREPYHITHFPILPSLTMISLRYDPWLPRPARITSLAAGLLASLFICAFFYAYANGTPGKALPPLSLSQQVRGAAAVQEVCKSSHEMPPLPAQLLLSAITSAFVVAFSFIIDPCMSASGRAEFKWRFQQLWVEVLQRRGAEKRFCSGLAIEPSAWEAADELEESMDAEERAEFARLLREAEDRRAAEAQAREEAAAAETQRQALTARAEQRAERAALRKETRRALATAASFAEPLRPKRKRLPVRSLRRTVPGYSGARPKALDGSPDAQAEGGASEAGYLDVAASLGLISGDIDAGGPQSDGVSSEPHLPGRSTRTSAGTPPRAAPVHLDVSTLYRYDGPDAVRQIQAASWRRMMIDRAMGGEAEGSDDDDEEDEDEGEDDEVSPTAAAAASAPAEASPLQVDVSLAEGAGEESSASAGRLASSPALRLQIPGPASPIARPPVSSAEAPPPLNDAADAAAGGWVDPPACCVRRCVCVVRCCGRHPSQQAAFAAAQRAAVAKAASKRAADAGARVPLQERTAAHGLDSDVETFLDAIAAFLWAVAATLLLTLLCCGRISAPTGATQRPEGGEERLRRRQRKPLTPAEEAALTSRRCPGCPCTIQVRCAVTACRDAAYQPPPPPPPPRSGLCLPSPPTLSDEPGLRHCERLYRILPLLCPALRAVRLRRDGDEPCAGLGVDAGSLVDGRGEAANLVLLRPGRGASASGDGKACACS